MQISAGDLEARLAGLDAIGVGADGAVDRLAWTAEDDASGEWFVAQASSVGLSVSRDAAGNRWALPAGDGPWWVVGSHLDSVRRGGRLDGPLGVAAGFAVAAVAAVPVAVVSFTDEEGARFNTPTFGSRALVGRLDTDDALARTDDDGVTLAEAMRAAGGDPEALAALVAEARLADGVVGGGVVEPAVPPGVAHIRGMLELHIDQSRELDRAGRAAGVVSSLAARLRLIVELTGQADHAGTTPPDERADALLAAATLIVAADAAGVGHVEGAHPHERAAPVRCTATRILVEPNAPTAIAGHVRLWLDARAPDLAALDAWQAAVEAAAADLGVPATVTVSARSGPVHFDPAVRAALAGDDGGPEVVCFAGHDAGQLATHVPAGMVLVRNPTGISHSPQEDVALEDAAVAATQVLRAVEALA